MISIIVPIYNAQLYIDKCISSVINQSYNDWELILVDDGSKDTSLEICKKWANQDKRIAVISKANEGVSSARNAGLNAAKGEWVMFLDSDDALANDACETLIKEQVSCGADCIIFGIKQDSGIIWAPDHEDYYTNFCDFKRDFTYWLNTELLSPPFNKFFKMNLLTHGFRTDVSYGEDLIFNLEYLQNCKSIKIIKNLLYLHNNLNIGSITHNFKTLRINNIECWQKAIIEFAKSDNDALLNVKYIKDVIKYIRDLFRSDMSFQNKKEIAENWFSKSYWMSMKIPQINLPTSDKFILYCINHKAWRLLQTMWQIKTSLK